MHFCPICGYLLYTEQQQRMQLSCSACPYIYTLTTAVTCSQTLKVKTLEKVMDAEDWSKHGNKCAINCPKCSNVEAFFMELQTRSADEPMTIFYMCTKCKYDWKE
ncbi:DNA-directed RNA polymerase III subunit RPC11 [Pancytospora epiphaga]|nr:DNA-directed RNA polymerase III subunit RPC11 [Pancytospora epiphaga]